MNLDNFRACINLAELLEILLLLLLLLLLLVFFFVFLAYFYGLYILT